MTKDVQRDFGKIDFTVKLQIFLSAKFPQIENSQLHSLTG